MTHRTYVHVAVAALTIILCCHRLDLTDTDTDGTALDFSQLKGKVTYCVNGR